MLVLPQETALPGSKTATARSFTFTPHKITGLMSASLI